MLIILSLAPAGHQAGAAPPPFGTGDWKVTGLETMTNESLLLAGNLVIESGGTLVITNSTLNIYCSVPSEHEVRVKSGGTLRVLGGSVLKSFDEFAWHEFTIEAGAVVEFSDSTFLSCGIRYDEIAHKIVGGIICYSSLMTVNNCTFAGAHIAITFWDAAVSLSCSTFSNCYIGTLTIGNTQSYRNCTWDKCGIAAWVVFSTADFSDCTFINNSFGIDSHMSSIGIRGCSFIGSWSAGLFSGCTMGRGGTVPSGPSTFFLEDCYFSGNKIGICHHPEIVSNTLTIIDCNFENNQEFGMRWGNRESSAPGPMQTIWRTTKPCRISNDTFDYNGQVIVEDGGLLTIDNSSLSVDSDYDGMNSIEVKSGGGLAILRGSEINATDKSYQYGLICRPGSSFVMEDSYLRDAGYDLQVRGKSGPHFEGAGVRIEGSIIDYCPVALSCNDSENVSISNSYLRGLDRCISAAGSSITATNSTLAGAGITDFSLDNASVIDALNTTLVRNELLFGDLQSRLNISWYLDVCALWSDGSPAKNATVAINDRGGNCTFNGTVDPSGWVRRLAVHETTITAEETVDFTPHLINCTRGPLYNLTFAVISKSLSVVIRLTDDQIPSVTIQYPSDGSTLNTGTLRICGTASDNLCVARVEIEPDGIRKVTAYDFAGIERYETGWNCTVALSEGTHHIEAIVYDRAGNSASAQVTVCIDTVMPRIVIAHPYDGLLTNQSVIGVTGYMEPGVRVQLGGLEVTTERDTFKGTAILGEGDNLLTAIASDSAGNTNSSSVRVRLDTLAPALNVTYPPEGLRLNVPVVDVTGTIEEGCDVLVNGRRVALTGGPGTFATNKVLSGEINRIVVDVADPAGNHNITVRTVYLDTRPPALQVKWPPDGLITNSSALTVSGLAETGSQVTAGINWTSVSGGAGAELGDFSVPVKLQEGTNTIVMMARDDAGNINLIKRHVVLDTVAPPLSVTYPDPDYKTANSTVFIVGLSERNAIVTVNGMEAPPGLSGQFSTEVRLSTGVNRITIRAEDQAGNSREVFITIVRLSAPFDGDGPATRAGPDILFTVFLALSVSAVAADAVLALRHFGRKSSKNRMDGGV